MHEYEKAQIILVNYRRIYPRSLNESLTTHISIAPNHPQVIPYHIDDHILQQMNAADYCDLVRHNVHNVRKCLEGNLYSAILNNKYLSMDPITDSDQAERMHVARMTFYRKLHYAIGTFAKVCHKRVLNSLYKHVNKQ